jgi:histidine triad (HIT) family protein
VRRALFWLARLPIAHALVRVAFAHLAWAIPLRRVYETREVVAFHHPRPSWPTHVLVVPKRAVASLLALDDLAVVEAIVAAAGAAASRLGLADTPCTLLVNGGAWQDVGQMHFHLIAGDPDWWLPPPGPLPPGRLQPHPEPRRATHLVVAGPLLPGVAAARERAGSIAPAGFALALCGHGLRDLEHVHLIAGARRRPASP